MKLLDRAALDHTKLWNLLTNFLPERLFCGPSSVNFPTSLSALSIFFLIFPSIWNKNNIWFYLQFSYYIGRTIFNILAILPYELSKKWNFIIIANVLIDICLLSVKLHHRYLIQALHQLLLQCPYSKVRAELQRNPCLAFLSEKGIC